MSCIEKQIHGMSIFYDRLESCSFCLRPKDECKYLFYGVTGKSICNDCLPLIREKMKEDPPPLVA